MININRLRDLLYGTPKIFDNITKGVKCNLFTTLKKDQYYTLAVSGEFNENDIVGVWLGSDKFIGYLQDNKITFKSNIAIDDDYVVLKSLSEEGIINQLKIKEV